MIAITTSCNMALEEALRTPGICYHLLANHSKVAKDMKVRGELILLAQQSTSRCPSFSAGGFFDVDFKLLLGLFGSITSYVIIIIQVNK